MNKIEHNNKIKNDTTISAMILRKYQAIIKEALH